MKYSIPKWLKIALIVPLAVGISVGGLMTLIAYQDNTGGYLSYDGENDLVGLLFTVFLSWFVVVAGVLMAPLAAVAGLLHLLNIRRASKN